MSNKILKHKKDSLIVLTQKYANDHMACVHFFIESKWPTGFYCEKCNCVHYYYIQRSNVLECKNCGHQHYLFAGTIFQDNKLELYKLILGMYLFFTANKGISAVEMTSALNVNYKTALRLCKKCRILMAQSNSQKILDSMFYESDVVYIGAKSQGKTGMATDQQPFLVILSTDKENNYPNYIKLSPISVDNKNYIENFMTKKAKLSQERTLNTDGKTTYSLLRDKINVQSEKIIYTEKNHRLYWLNVIVGNIKNNITGIYHGVPKRSLPLFLNEQEWRFNHRNIGNNVMNRIKKYISMSFPATEKTLTYILDLSEPVFTNPVSEG